MKQHSWKKQLLTAAVLGAITTIPATGMAAAAGGFDDVPHDNWSYGAIQTLLKDGVIDSFDDNTFNGQKIVTRFEMAQIVRRATNKAVNSTTLSDNDKALIIKLSQEYGKELNQLKSGSLSNSSASAGATMVRPGKNGIMDFSGTKAYIRYCCCSLILSTICSHLLPKSALCFCPMMVRKLAPRGVRDANLRAIMGARFQ